MGRINDTVGTINTTLRTLLMLALVGIAGVAGYKGYEIYNEPRQLLADKQAELDTTLKSLRESHTALEARTQEVANLNIELANTTAELERLEVRMSLLKVQTRLARLTVIEQREVAETEGPETADASRDESTPANIMTKIEFVEVSKEGDPIGVPRQFEIVGDMVYIDYLRVSFDDNYVEENDLDRSTAIALFQRLFGEHQEAAEGYTLDRVGTRPAAYDRGTEMSDFERKIWSDFWLIANDQQKAAELGIHAAHSSAVGMRVRPGMTYEVELRATGDLTIRPIDPARTAVNENPAPAEPPK